jgi:hypothetical protein
MYWKLQGNNIVVYDVNIDVMNDVWDNGTTCSSDGLHGF